MPGVFNCRSVRHFMRFMWYGQRKNKNFNEDKGDTYMPKLRTSLLEWIRIAGNYSGCHQLPERSFFYKGKQFPVCARCTGVCFGQISALISGLFKVSLNYQLCVALLLVMGADWFMQEINLKKSTNLRRLVTGFMGGFGLFTIYILVLRKIFELTGNYLKTSETAVIRL